MAHLEARVCIVTGAGRGIGDANAGCLAAEGAKVVVSDPGVNLDGTGRSQGPAEATVAGRVIGARGHEITPHNVPEPVRTIAGPEPWEFERAFALIERTFRPAGEPANRYSTPPPRATADN